MTLLENNERDYEKMTEIGFCSVDWEQLEVGDEIRLKEFKKPFIYKNGKINSKYTSFLVSHKVYIGIDGIKRICLKEK